MTTRKPKTSDNGGAANIQTKTGRAVLPPRKEPYWQRLTKGGYIGFRVLESGGGSWIARWRDDAGKQRYNALGEFDYFDDAAREASKWFESCGKGVVVKPMTIAECCESYVEHLRTTKTPGAAHDAHMRFSRLIHGKPIAKKTLDKLRFTDLQHWLTEQLAHVDLDDDDGAVRSAKCSANRNLASFKAALNFAHQKHLTADDSAWRTVKPFRGANQRRERDLTMGERQALLNACREDLRQFVQGLLLTAARPGELANCTVKDFDRARGTLVLDGKIGRRVVALSTRAVLFFTECSKHKTPLAPLLARHDGAAWGKDYWKKLLTKAVKLAGIPDDTVLYSIQHTAISELVSSGMDSCTVAALAGTSTAMIDKHYGHLRHDQTRARLDQVQII